MNTSPQSRSISVTGFCRGTSVAALTKYFTSFGSIEKVFIQNSKTSQICKIIAGDLDTFEKILSFAGHQLKGRDLLCSKFLYGKALYERLKIENKNRVIIKNIPHGVNEDDLVACLEREIGSMTRVYHFKSERKKQTFRKYSSFAVCFSTQEQAGKATSGKNGEFI